MWEQIRSNRIRSVLLVSVIAGILLALGYFLGYYFLDSPTGGLVIAFIVWAILSLIAYYQGDSIFLSMAHARKIGPDDAPRLYNVVEEMKIASGLEKMPDIYIVDDPALNAFATGRDPNRASVAITSGLLQKLNRDELQGVIGHEISHIKNRDVLLMAMTGVMLGAIVMLSWYASRFFLWGGMAGGGRRSSSRDSGGGYVQLIILVVGIVLMILAPIMAQLIYYAISRKREYLADASSALYTRYPEGLASALEKLGNATGQLKSANQATAPMYIVNPLHKEGMKVSDLTSTHPPISERIRILRAMAGGAAFANYEEAYRKVHSGRGILSKATIAGAGVGMVGIREASPVEMGTMGPASEKVARTREVADIMQRVNQYRIVDCECGARWKVPPGFKDDAIICTRCGRRLKV